MNPAIYVAAASGDETIFRNFSSDEFLKKTQDQKNSVLHVATLHKQRHFVEMILQHSPGSLLNHKNSDGDTSLHVAARIGCEEIGKLLIDHGRYRAGTAVETSYMKMVLSFIIYVLKYMSAEVSALLGIEQKLIKMVNSKKDSALHAAVRNGHRSVVELLIKEDCKLTLLTNSSGESPLFVAVERKFFEIAKYLLDNTKKCSLAGRDGMNALHAAVVYLHNYLDTSSSGEYSELLGEEDDATFDSNCNYTKLQGIVTDMVKKYPTAVEQQDYFGWTPVHYAAHFGLQDVINLFLTYRKSSAYKKDKEGMSAFHLASKKGQVRIMEELITFCPDIFESSTSNGQTALHVAVTSRQKKAVVCLLKERAGSNVGVLNKQDTDGNTPLHLAAILEDYEILSTLLNDTRLEGNAVNKDGLTAMDIILSCKELQEPQKSDIVAKLKSLGGFPSLKEQLPERTAKMPDIIATTEKPRPQSEDDNKEDKLPNKKRKKFRVIPECLYVLGNPKNIQNPSEVDLLLATLIATITFAAAFQVPGGYESDGPYMGLPILRHKSDFKVFMILDSLALGFSTSSLFLHFLAVVGPNKRDNVNCALIIAHLTTYLSIIAMAATFIVALSLVLGNSGGVTPAACASFACYGGVILYTCLAVWVDKVTETK